MDDFLKLTRFSFVIFKNKITSINKNSIIKLLMVLLFASFFFPSIYYLFFYIFKHFYNVIVVGPLLVNKLLNGFYMTFSLMIILSSIAASISVFFFSRDTEFLFSLPIKLKAIFFFKIYRIFIASSWMVIAVAFPVFFAYTRVIKIDIVQYVFIIIAHIPFCIILSSVGVVFALLLVHFFPAEKVRNFSIGILGIFMVFVIIYFRMLQPEKLTASSFDEMGQFIKALNTPEFILMPHVQFINIVKEITIKGVFLGSIPLLLFFFVAFLVFSATVFFAKKFYFASYGRKNYYERSRKHEVNFSYSKQPFFIIQIIKDFRLSIRDTTQWLQVVFLAGLIAIYLFNLYKLPKELYNLKQLIYYLNIFFVGMILSAIGARLILPVVSIEGRGFWLYKSAPISIIRYLFYKLFMCGSLILFLGLIVSFISATMLSPGRFITILTVFTVLMITVVISCMGIGLSAFFADFNIKSHEDLLIGVPGIVYMFASMLFMTMLFFLESDIIKMYYISQVVRTKVFNFTNYIINIVFVLILSFLFSFLPLLAGIKRLEKMEI